MRVLLTGASGQLGQEIQNSKLFSKYTFTNTTSEVLNLSNFKEVQKFINDINPNIIINTAAYTDVDRAEEEQDKAYLINALAIENIAKITKDTDTKIIHFSTDYVFGKNELGPFHENDVTAPINHYGFTKAEGEKKALDINDNVFIIRVASLYSQYGNNFVKKMINLLEGGQMIKVINDQKISLTNAVDIVKALPNIIDFRSKNNSNKNKNKMILHLTNLNYTTWFDVAKKIRDYIVSNNYFNIESEVEPISSLDWKSQASRPVDSRLYIDDEFLEGIGISMPMWHDSLEKFIDNHYYDKRN
tara:strand:+ start:3845 stop:4750 length:906 start_codon:yes stop_codon:yes gene_type:complete